MLIFIGLGPSIYSITLAALKALDYCDEVYLDAYTSIILDLDLKKFEEITGKKPVLLSRKDLEGEGARDIIRRARERNIAIIVGGDPFIATTHISLRIDAEKQGVKTIVYNGVSAYTAVISVTGLQIYKFGKPVTIVFPFDNLYFTSPYYVLLDNLSRNLHTFFFLDIKAEERLFMTINDSIKILLEIEEKLLKEGEIRNRILPSLLGIGVAKAGTRDVEVKAALLKNLLHQAFASPPHSLIIPGKLHDVEKEALQILGGAKKEDIIIHEKTISQLCIDNKIINNVTRR